MVDDARRLEPLADEAAEMLTAMANPNNLLVLCALISGEQAEETLCRSLGPPAEAFDQAVADLREAGLVSDSRKTPGSLRLRDIRAAEIADAVYSAFMGQSLVEPGKARFQEDPDNPGGYGVFARDGI